MAVAVDDAAIRVALSDLGHREGLAVEPAAAATLAALRQIGAGLPRPVVLIGSAHVLKDPPAPPGAPAASTANLAPAALIAAARETMERSAERSLFQHAHDP